MRIAMVLQAAIGKLSLENVVSEMFEIVDNRNGHNIIETELVDCSNSCIDSVAKRNVWGTHFVTISDCCLHIFNVVYPHNTINICSCLFLYGFFNIVLYDSIYFVAGEYLFFSPLLALPPSSFTQLAPVQITQLLSPVVRTYFIFLHLVGLNPHLLPDS